LPFKAADPRTDPSAAGELPLWQIVNVDGAVVIRKRISRPKLLEFFAAPPPCLIGIEACPTAHHWSRGLQALGHTVRLTPPSYVKAYVKRSKNDANDAAAIREAVTRPLSLAVLARQYAAITTEIGAIEKQIHAWHRSCEEPGSIRLAVRRDSEESQSNAIDICDGCSSLALWPSSDIRDSTARNGSGSRA
jgi:hypothetical protein